MKRLSGDQKGKIAPCVPASGLASVESSARTQSCTLPPVAAVKARYRPSGDTAIWPKLDFSGGRMEVLKTRASEASRRVKCAHANPNTPSNNAAAKIQASRAWSNKRDGLAPAASVRAPDDTDNASSA